MFNEHRQLQQSASNSTRPQFYWSRRCPRRYETRHLFLLTTTRPAPGPNQHPVQWAPVGSFPGIKRSRYRTDYPPPFSAQAKNERSYTSNPPVWLHSACRGNFTFPLSINKNHTLHAYEFKLFLYCNGIFLYITILKIALPDFRVTFLLVLDSRQSSILHGTSRGEYIPTNPRLHAKGVSQQRSPNAPQCRATAVPTFWDLPQKRPSTTSTPQRSLFSFFLLGLTSSTYSMQVSTELLFHLITLNDTRIR